MELTLNRKIFSNERTIGELSIDGVHECYVVEDTVREDGKKVYGKTAIPAGRYEVLITFSNRFQRPMPLLVNVPNFDGVRIHTGNTELDTEGCLIVGAKLAPNNAGVLDSRIAFGCFYPKLKRALKVGKVFINIGDFKNGHIFG